MRIALNVSAIVLFGLSAIPFCDDEPAAVGSIVYPLLDAISLNLKLPYSSPPLSVRITKFNPVEFSFDIPCVLEEYVHYLDWWLFDFT